MKTSDLNQWRGFMSLLNFARAGALAGMLVLPAHAQDNSLVPETPDVIEQEDADDADADGSADMAATPGKHTLTKKDVDAWLDGFMPYALDKSRIAGAVVSVSYSFPVSIIETC